MAVRIGDRFLCRLRNNFTVACLVLNGRAMTLHINLIPPRIYVVVMKPDTFSAAIEVPRTYGLTLTVVCSVSGRMPVESAAKSRTDVNLGSPGPLRSPSTEHYAMTCSHVTSSRVPFGHGTYQQRSSVIAINLALFGKLLKSSRRRFHLTHFRVSMPIT
jgi:hypothetical protein